MKWSQLNKLKKEESLLTQQEIIPLWQYLKIIKKLRCSVGLDYNTREKLKLLRDDTAYTFQSIGN